MLTSTRVQIAPS